MASISNISNARSMNGIITITDGFAIIENGSITSDNITTNNIITDDINLNIGNGRTLSVFDDVNNKAYFTDIITLSSITYTNNNTYNNYVINKFEAENGCIHGWIILLCGYSQLACSICLESG